ncbi:immunoglobulin lambda-1 light chain [Nothobranchius furzeri]
MCFLPAAALCCLCSALVTMATQLTQGVTLTRRAGERVSISCGGTQVCTLSWIYWYQKKDTETFKAILGFDASNSEVYKGYGHPQQDEFSAENNQNGCELKLNKVQQEHAASYYCSCWVSGYIFGSGTKLYVSDQEVMKPVVTVCPVRTRTHQEEKTSLMCLASSMFPPVVRFAWKRQKKYGHLEDLSPDGEQLELKGSDRSVIIRQVDQESFYTYKFFCYVSHEEVTLQNETQEFSIPTTSPPDSSATPTRSSSQYDPSSTSLPPQLPVKQLVSFQSELRVKLLLLLYSELIVKSLVFCCGLSLMMIFKNKGASTTC